MPSRLACCLIILFWLVSMAWLVQRDVLPAFGVGEFTYDRALSARAIEEPVEWDIYRAGERVGHLFFTVQPQPDGTFQLQSRASLAVALPGLEASDFNVSSIIYVSPLKRLDRFTLLLSVPQNSSEVSISGESVDGEIDLTARLMMNQQELFKRTFRLSGGQQVMVLDPMGQLDRIPDLRLGKTWRTRFINPIRVLLGGTSSFTEGMDYLNHRVIGTEEMAWNDQTWLVYKVEHRYQNAVTHSWARVSDGKVLVQEVMFGGVEFQLVALPSPSEKPSEAPTHGP